MQAWRPDKAREPASAFGSIGPHVANAERSLFINCLSTGPVTPLAWVDGAHLFWSTIDRLLAEAGNEAQTWKAKIKNARDDVLTSAATGLPGFLPWLWHRNMQL